MTKKRQTKENLIHLEKSLEEIRSKIKTFEDFKEWQVKLKPCSVCRELVPENADKCPICWAKITKSEIQDNSPLWWETKPPIDMRHDDGLNGLIIK